MPETHKKTFLGWSMNGHLFKKCKVFKLNIGIVNALFYLRWNEDYVFCYWVFHPPLICICQW